MSVSNEKAVERLVREMGFNRTEVNMALKDASGNVEKAIEKLLSGNYAPPPYTAGGAEQTGNLPSYSSNSQVVEDKKSKLYPSMPNVFSSLTNRDKAPIFISEDPTAPPLFNSIVDMSANSDFPDLPKINALPPPYQKVEKESKIKDWEVHMNVVYLNRNTEPQHQENNLLSKSAGFNPIADERCPVCFNSTEEGNPGEQVVCHNGKVFHHNCFMRKHGPKCAYCCFPLTQADKDHELSGKYLVYQNKDYHVECYEKYAGPRCTSCFNVIIEKPNGEFSGNWVVDKKQEYHVECLQKKLYAAWRAKHS